MTMSEFDRRSQKLGDDCSQHSTPDTNLPTDFSEEEVAFAKELRSFFSIEEEEMPPYFVQTLLEPDDPRYQPVEEGFEQKTYARVSRRLKLHRRLYRSRHAFIRTNWPIEAIRRPVMAVIAACLLIMLVTMIVVSPSFARGLNILLAGPHSGVIQVNSDPADDLTPAPVHFHQPAGSAPAFESPQPPQISLTEALRELQFPLYVPDQNDMPTHYTLSSIFLYQMTDQAWSDGPIVQLNYDSPLPGMTLHGTGEITIREFKPVGMVAQVVRLGAAHMKVDKDGHASAIEIDGQWEPISQSHHQWVYSGRCELIYERDGVVFWIEGDQRDGIDGTVLFNIALSLQPIDNTFTLRMHNLISNVSLNNDDNSWLSSGVVLSIDSDNADAPPLLIVGNDSPKSDSHTH